MISNWPTDLPRPERNTYRRERQDARIVRTPSQGPQSFRKRFSNTAKTVSLTVLLSRDQLAVFDRFFEETTAQGTGLFRMPDPITDGTPLLNADGSPIVGADGKPLMIAAEWLCSFGEQMPSDSREGVETRVAFTVQVFPV